MTVERLIEGWSDRTREAAAGRHVLAIQDTSAIKLSMTAEERRGLGKVKKGNAYGVSLHAMIGVDADSGAMLGLVGGRIWTRKGDVATPHAKRPLTDKESARWIDTAETARQTLARAAMITVVADRESDFYAHWARTPGGNVHLLARMMNDHAVVGGGKVRKAVADMPVAGQAVVELREKASRRPRCPCAQPDGGHRPTDTARRTSLLRKPIIDGRVRTVRQVRRRRGRAFRAIPRPRRCGGSPGCENRSSTGG